jgi:hypothetical protein
MADSPHDCGCIISDGRHLLQYDRLIKYSRIRLFNSWLVLVSLFPHSKRQSRWDCLLFLYYILDNMEMTFSISKGFSMKPTAPRFKDA